MITRYCLKHMGIERWVLKPVNLISPLVLVVLERVDMTSNSLLKNMLSSIGLIDSQVCVCVRNDLASLLFRVKPRLILALGSVGPTLLGDNISLETCRQQILSYQSIPLVLSNDLFDILNQPRMKKTVQDDLVFMQAWLNS